MLTKTEQELLWALKAALDWIDSIPDDIKLPAMPGFDRDWVESLIDNCSVKNKE